MRCSMVMGVWRFDVPGGYGVRLCLKGVGVRDWVRVWVKVVFELGWGKG